MRAERGSAAGASSEAPGGVTPVTADEKLLLASDFWAAWWPTSPAGECRVCLFVQVKINVHLDQAGNGYACHSAYLVVQQVVRWCLCLPVHRQGQPVRVTEDFWVGLQWTRLCSR
jgi:hypothetical protein